MTSKKLGDHCPGSKIHLIGYTSTSKDIKTALKFAFDFLKKDQIPVIFVINFKGQNGLFELTPEYTAFPSENEVLIQDGLKYYITNKDVIELKGKQVYLISFAYPANI